MGNVSKSRGLFDPIERTEEMPTEMFQEYIDVCDASYRTKTQTTIELSETIKEIFYSSHANVGKDKLDTIWEFWEERIETNEALARFVLDFRGAESDFFFPWVMSVGSSPSEALELGYNACRNLNGDWIDAIPENDPIYRFVTGMPTLAYNRLRQLTVANLVLSERDRCVLPKSVTPIMKETPVYHYKTPKSKVLDLGAGRMAWARHHGFWFSPIWQDIIAFDLDQGIEPKKLFTDQRVAIGSILAPLNKLNDWELSELGISYIKGNFIYRLPDLICEGATLAILQGVASYYPKDTFREAIMKPIYCNLVDGGRFFFDLQIKHISYVWGCKLFGWPEMILPESVSEAIDNIEKTLKMLRKEGLHFRASYEPDSSNKEPLSVMVTLTKD